jgi:serine/threonine-protein kinase
MGEVYRARDPRMGRDVAIKVSVERFSDRFEREVRAVAALNHPNICQIYDVGPNYLVMELIEGPTLAERIKQGAIPLEEAVPIACQIADALDAAHEKGIIHRDLKPANIKIKPDGVVKVLDFGLAKIAEPAAPPDHADDSPTLTIESTRVGQILGTAAYMSPEQARGKTVDKRADIWAFGVVLYEMLTGRRLFVGDTISDTLVAVLKTEPDLSSVAGPARSIVERCLRRDPRRRWRDIGDVRLAIEEGTPQSPGSVNPPTPRSAIPWLATALMTVAFFVTGMFLWRATRPVDYPLVRLSVDLGPDALTGFSTTVSISPDGRRLVFPARGPDGKPQLAMRLLEHAKHTLLPGTAGAQDPFFSPDGQWVGFFAEGKLKKIPIIGGAPVTVCDVASPRGGSWGLDSNIVAAMGPFSGLSRVPVSGGTPQRLTRLTSGEVTHRWPQLLPGDRAVLFTAAPTPVGMEEANVEVTVLKTGITKILHHGGYYARYLPSGHLVYAHEGVLFGVPFDLDRMELQGTPTPLVEDLAGNSSQGAGQFSFSQTGTLVYLPSNGPTQGWPIAWLDNSGQTQPLLAEPGFYYEPRLSPDGQRLALTIASKGSNIFVYDSRRVAMTRLTFEGNASVPVWTPDGKHIVYRSSMGFRLWWVRSDGAGEPQRLLEGQSNIVPWSFSADGRRLAYHEINPETGFDIWTISLDTTDPDHPKAGKPEPFLRTRFDEAAAAFSPDGRWIAYRSNESGGPEIYVKPFPSAGGKWQVSAGGGLYAFWSRDGRKLFYEAADGRIMETDYTVNADSFVPGNPRLWTDRQVFYPGSFNLDLAPDGKRFAVFGEPENTGLAKGSVHVVFLQNFFDEVRRRLAGQAR